MKLKLQREDVKRILSGHYEANGLVHILPSKEDAAAARRYLNLIRMAERQFKYLEEFHDVPDGLWPQEKRVLRDAGLDK